VEAGDLDGLGGGVAADLGAAGRLVLGRIAVLPWPAEAVATDRSRWVSTPPTFGRL
jgi:hypothetical protein